ncbi:MAG TPA: hypothetical protein VFG86_28045, partial [Chloroflexota bacterium]|nr:hypothetical protein [Chloroflexota bacterium]
MDTKMAAGSRRRLLAVMCISAALICVTIGVAVAAHAPLKTANTAEAPRPDDLELACDGMPDGAPACLYGRAVLADAPLALWRLSDSEGVAFSPQGVTPGAAGALEGSTALQFDGVDGSARIGIDLSTTSTATVEFWLNWNGYADDDRLALEYGGPTYMGHS